jgi:hypothetical protein
VKTGSNVAESSKENYGSERALLQMMMRSFIIQILHKILLEQSNGRICSTHEEDKPVQAFGRKTKRKREHLENFGVDRWVL